MAVKTQVGFWPKTRLMAKAHHNGTMEDGLESGMTFCNIQIGKGIGYALVGMMRFWWSATLKSFIGIRMVTIPVDLYLLMVRSLQPVLQINYGSIRCIDPKEIPVSGGQVNHSLSLCKMIFIVICWILFVCVLFLCWLMPYKVVYHSKLTWYLSWLSRIYSRQVDTAI